MTPRRRDGDPVISVITVVRNDRPGLERTLTSVFSQNYPHLNYIVVDGGSTDGSKDLLVQHSAAIDAWVSEPDRGIYEAMNKGVSMASGNLVLFLNAADVFAGDDVLNRFAAILTASDEAVVYLCRVLTDRGRLIDPRPLWLKRRVRMPTYHQGVIYPLDALRESGFDTSYRLAADYHHLVLLCRHLPCRPVDITLTVYDTHGQSSTRRAEADAEFYRIYRELGLGWPSALYRRLCNWFDRVTGRFD